MLYDAEQKRIDTKMKDTLQIVQAYSNKTYEDRTKNCKNMLEKAQKHRNERLAYYENRPKEYKAIKRYGQVLEKVERLLKIIPEPKKEFSLEDLADKMKKLIESRQKMTNHTTFTYFQNVLTNSITNLLNIEREFQSGALNETSAKSKSTELIRELRENRMQIPNDMMWLLGSSFDQAIKMAEMYEQTFANLHEKKQRMGLKFVDTDLSEREKIVTSELNFKTQALMANISSLDSKLSDFEPQVDLTALTGKIEKADKIMEDVVFDADNLDSAVTDIELAADNLTSEQNYKNQQSDSLTIEINSLTQKTEKLSKETIEQTTYAIKLNLNARLDATMTNSEYIQDLVEDGVINEDVAEAISDTMQSQASADKMVAPKLDANAVAPCNAMNVAEQLEDCAAEINEAVQEARRERNPDWDSDEEDDDENNRSN